MARRKNHVFLALTLILSFVVMSCRATVKTYDPDTDIRYTAGYGYGDLKKLSAEMASRILASRIGKEPTPPVMLIFGIENRTDEHVDMKALAYAIRNDLIKSGKFKFINESRRKQLEKEMAYQDQGYVKEETRIKAGRQIGAKYILSGQLVSISQKDLKQVRIKKKSLRYYRLTLEITDINTALIEWTDELEIVREQATPFIGW